ncbi:hypothetical protein A5746_05075 [Mycolicibacterium conceptionense]|nr:hypothetical protein A5746_05075 [Mycolicibacterium conceptionense]SKK24372.1 Uncharacterised protein [Mycobacteroides abscessus subsp. massiliense]
MGVMPSDSEEAAVSSGVGELLSGPAYQQSAEDRQVALLDAIRRLHVEIETKQRDLMRLIEEAQRQGASWSKIGEAQNVSAQAAQQRSKRWRAHRSDKTSSKS